ncbi:MAG: DUF1517 domain-containing protein, partial [Oscillatoriales cyanobacterium]
MNVLRPLFAFTLVTVLANAVSFDGATTQPVTFGLESAIARSSGGRSGGGSFGRSSGSRSSGSSSGSRSSSPTTTRSPAKTTIQTSPTSTSPTSNTRGNSGGVTRGGSFNRSPAPVAPTQNVTPQPNRDRNLDQDDRYRNVDPAPRPVIIYNNNVPPSSYDPSPHTPIQNNYVSPSEQTIPTTNTNGGNTAQSDDLTFGDVLILLVVLLVFALVAAGLVYLGWQLLKRLTSPPKSELENDVVTVSKLQIALLASAKGMQAKLTHLSEIADLDSSSGLAEFATNCTLTLLRHPEYWTHAASQSETVKTRAEAQQRFERISIEERMKFDAETFSRTGDRLVAEERSAADPDLEVPEYIVVTLVVGTENDQALFPPVHSAEDLEAALKTIGSLSGDYLSVFELLWTPQ